MKIDYVHYFPGGVPVRIGYKFRLTSGGRWHYLMSDRHTAKVINREKARQA
jgi:hypothetical protein